MAVWHRHVAGRTCTCLLAALWLLPPRSTTWSAGFTNASVAPARPLLQRRASDLEERRAKCPLSQEQLESDHGDKWEDVRDILVGLRASSPEAIMRARFTALRFQDPQFLAATEKDDNQSIRDRAKQWSLLLGLEEMGMFDKMMNLNSDAFNLREPAGFEVLSADGEWVEFKIVCSSKTLTEKSRFVKDRKYGWIYGGETEYSQWS
ncbi:unnamed protein product [Symbiodinium sp. CCMP2592]|nr:unnamed protein product [Symbiodinium sp. CCMP2592]